MRRDAGRSQEPLMIAAFLLIAAFVGLVAAPPWGIIVVPAALVIGAGLLWLVLIGSFKLYFSRCRVRLLAAARERRAMARDQWSSLVYDNGLGPSDRDAVLAVARDPSHPLQECFLAIAIREWPDADIVRLAAERIIATPVAVWTLLDDVMKSAPPELAERVVVAGIESGDPRIARQVVAKLLVNATLCPSPELDDIVVRLAARLEPHLMPGNDLSLRTIRERRSKRAG